jgi:hypothetical protein
MGLCAEEAEEQRRSYDSDSKESRRGPAAKLI